MLLSNWVVVTTVFWYAVSWSSITVNGACPTEEEQKEMAKQITKADQAKAAKTGVAIGTSILSAIGNIGVIASNGTMASSVLGLLGAMDNIAALTNAGINMFGPKDPQNPHAVCPLPNPQVKEIKEMMEQVLPAVKDLSNLLVNKFDGLNSTIREATEKIIHALEEHDVKEFKRDWQTYVVKPMIGLRFFANRILQNFTHPYARSYAEQMAPLCMHVDASPNGIAQYMLSAFGNACKSKKGATTRQGVFCDPGHSHWSGPCRNIQNECYAEQFIKFTGHDHHSADYLYQLIMGTTVELIMYQSICVNFTYQDPGAIHVSNDRLNTTVTQLLNDAQKIIVNETERYWPTPAEELVKSVISQHAPDFHAGMREAHKALNKKFYWFHHLAISASNMSNNATSHFNSEPISVADSKGRGWASHYRYIADNDKTILKEKLATFASWLQSRMTGPYANFTVRQFFEWVAMQDDDWSSKTGGEVEKYANPGYGTMKARGYLYSSNGFTDIHYSHMRDEECHVSTTETSCLWYFQYAGTKNAIFYMPG